MYWTDRSLAVSRVFGRLYEGNLHDFNGSMEGNRYDGLSWELKDTGDQEMGWLVGWLVVGKYV